METLLDVKKVSQLLGCSARSVFRLADSGRMPGRVKVGSLVRWRESDLRQWLDAGCPRTQPPQMSEAARAALQARKGSA
jgi:excisionase family DNA binding protein